VKANGASGAAHDLQLARLGQLVAPHAHVDVDAAVDVPDTGGDWPPMGRVPRAVRRRRPRRWCSPWLPSSGGGGAADEGDTGGDAGLRWPPRGSADGSASEADGDVDGGAPMAERLADAAPDAEGAADGSGVERTGRLDRPEDEAVEAVDRRDVRHAALDGRGGAPTCSASTSEMARTAERTAPVVPPAAATARAAAVMERTTSCASDAMGGPMGGPVAGRGLHSRERHGGRSRLPNRSGCSTVCHSAMP
jgi:hypothetical protein